MPHCLPQIQIFKYIIDWVKLVHHYNLIEVNLVEFYGISIFVGYLQPWKNRAMNCKAYSSFDGVFSNHRIVTANIRLSLRKKNATWTATTKHYDWALLNNRDIRDKYVVELRNRFETLQEKIEKGAPNDVYENFVNAHLEAAGKCIPTEPRTKYTVPWETVAVREKTYTRENCL